MEDTPFTQQKERWAYPSTWKMLLDQSLRNRAEEAALFVADCMRDPEYVQQIAQAAKEQRGSALFWDLTFPSSAAHLALFYHHIARCFPDADWQKAAHCYLKLIATNSQRHGVGAPALFGGISGIAFTIQQCSEAGRYYQQTLAHLNCALVEEIRSQPSWSASLETEAAELDFDLISGASGVIGYLTILSSYDQHVHETLDLLLRYLLKLVEPGQPLGRERWFCPPSRLHEQERRRFPHGRFNCGLAHGIAGPLVALSLVAIAGYDAPGLLESIAYVSQWLVDHQIYDEWGITWPAAIPYELASSPEQWRSLPGARTAWCYGAPGIARSLWLAGLVLKEERLMNIALDALKAVLRRPESRRNIVAPILCHGNAGLLLICLHFAHESQDPFILAQIPHLVERVLEQFDPQSPLGFRDIEPGGKLVDQPDLLTGAAGTALALLAAACEVAPSWDRLLLLS